METFGIQYEMGQDGMGESNSMFAQIWDGPIQVISLIRRGDGWIVEQYDIDYVTPESIEGEWSTVADVVNVINEELELV